MKLKPRTTYHDRNGHAVHIAGLTDRTLDGKPIYWSIQGNHYTEDGRFVFAKQGRRDLEDLPTLEYYTAETSQNIAEEDPSEEGKRWWDNVKTQR